MVDIDDLIRMSEEETERLREIKRKREMDLITEYSGQLKKGDLIIVSYDNRMVLAIYLGRGQGGSVQYYNLGLLYHWYMKELNGNPPRPYKDYINSPRPDRISKYSRDLLEGDWIEIYDIAIKALKELNIL